MEVSQRASKASKFAPEEFISNMPDNVVTNILDRLPLQDAVRTSALSRKWRFKWTIINQLVFDKKFFAYLSRTKGNNNHVRIISRILLDVRGAITKFVLFKDESLLDDEDVNHWISFLSRKGIKDLTIKNRGKTLLLSPTHLFSCLELEHLKLYRCCLRPPPNFHDFPYLRSLDLSQVQFGSSNEDFEFLTRCRLLESLKLNNLLYPVKVNLVATAKLKNLRRLSLSLCDLEPMAITSSSTIYEILGSLSKLLELHLDFLDCELIVDGHGAKKTFLTTFPCLKVLKLKELDLEDDIIFSFAFELIGSFPNLQTCEIKVKVSDNYPLPPTSFPEVDCNTTGPLQLRNVIFTSCCNASGNDVTLMKYLLACSPNLKKFVIRFNEVVEPDEKLMFARKVLNLQRAYPAIDIDLC